MDRFRRAAVVCMLAVAGLGLSWAPAAPLPGARASVHIARAVRVAHAALSGGLSAQPVLGVPALDFTLVGGSPGEATGEAWAQGDTGDVPASIGAQAIPPGTQVLMRYTPATGTWQIVPVDDAQGQLLAFGWVASEVTAAGGVALIGTDSVTEAQ